MAQTSKIGGAVGAVVSPLAQQRSVNLEPTSYLRFVERQDGKKKLRILQQWWAEQMPSYMRDVRKGEWKDVLLEDEK
jgi:hypothetical protein